MSIHADKYPFVGKTSNTRYHAVEDGIVLGIPNDGSVDDSDSAAQNVQFQVEYFRTQGRGGVVIILIDTLVAQTKEARRVYQTAPDTAFMRATALVGGRLLSRAIASFFLGLSKPRIPLETFADLERALAWAREINRQRDADDRQLSDA